MKVGLLIIATNKYVSFLQNLIDSSDKFFLDGVDVTYYVFTNQEISLSTDRKVVKIHTEHKDWPWMTLGRYQIFTDNKSQLSEMDYLYYCDVDMKFVGEVGEEIIGDRVGTIHPGYHADSKKSNIALETRKQSLAYLPFNTIEYYYAGGFNGGSASEFLKMSEILSHNIKQDLELHNIIAEWHDESHMNRYFHENRPTTILSPSYCYPERWSLSFEKKLLALDKNHNLMRS